MTLGAYALDLTCQLFALLGSTLVQAELIIVPTSGHSAREKETSRILLEQAEKFKTL